MPDRQFVFAPFRLDPVNEQLWQGEALVPLRPKLFAVLRHLVEHAGRLVPHEEIRKAVWPATVVSEGVLRGAIRELREVLGDDAIAARFVETVPHRGYRFVAPVSETQPVHAAALSARQFAPRGVPRPQNLILISRDTELARLQKWLDRALQGTRQVVFVTGEPGIGKTTVVDAFLAYAAGRGDLWTARGQCVEHYGPSEAYLPVLEALGQLCRQPEGGQVVPILSRYAPTWLAQMPGLIGEAEFEAVQRRAQGATRERMLRELAEAIEALTAATPLVLALEDLHWSDYSTLDLLSLLAQRRGPARLVLLGMYRPAEVIVSGHPLKALKQELRVHGQCEELALGLFTEVEVAQYLAARFPRQQLPPALGRALHQSTEGNPLFLVNVVDYWVSQKVLVETGGHWQLAAGVEDIAAGAPESLRQMIEKQVRRLTPEERRLLEAASVAGVEFLTAAVAAGLEEEGERVEEWCEGLAKRGQFLQARGTETGAEGRVMGRYGFLHTLYQQVLYERLAPVRRVHLHRRIGAWGERAYGERVEEHAAELAMHFERGHDYARAVRYFAQAGENALRRSAHPEAISLLTKGLEVLMTLPETPERVHHELALQATLGAALAVTKAYASPEVQHAHERAFQLCQQIGDTPQLFPVLAGLWGFRFLRAELHTARELAAQLLRLAPSTPDPALLLWAHTFQGLTLSTLGELPAALRHLEEGVALYDPQLHRPDRTRVGAQDPKMTCLSYAALTLWRLGYPEQARQRVAEALTWAQELSHPYSLAYALGYAALVHLFCREEQAARERAESAITLSIEQGFPSRLAMGTVVRGGALTEQGQEEEGVAQMQQGLAAFRAMGAETAWLDLLPLLAAAYAKAGQVEEGLSVVAEALVAVDKSGKHMVEAELYQLKGRLTLQQSGVQSLGSSVKKSSKSKVQAPKSKVSIPHSASAWTFHWPCTPQLEAEAETCFLKAIDIARRQQAKSLELRAGMSLSRLWRQQGKKEEARQLLAEIYGWFTEGFDTKDLQEAKALLKELK
jgi:DNA-binding winged helix-turn-helix (wHTH) protein/predicted ATPase